MRLGYPVLQKLLNRLLEYQFYSLDILNEAFLLI